MNDDFGEEYRKHLREQLKPIKQLEKIRLVSNNICYGPMPEPDEIVEQVLIIHADGRVSVSYHPFGAHSRDIDALFLCFFQDKIREIFISFDGKENVQGVKNCIENFNEKSWKSANGSFRWHSVTLNTEAEDKDMKRDAGKYGNVYKELLNILGSDAAVRKIWKAFAGTTVNFPKRLYARDYMLEYIREHMYDMKPSEIAKEMDFTERRVRQIMREIKEAENDENKENE